MQTLFMLLTLQGVYFFKKQMNAKKLRIYIKYIPAVPYLFKYDKVSALGFLIYCSVLRVGMQNNVLYCDIHFYLRLHCLIDLG